MFWLCMWCWYERVFVNNRRILLVVRCVFFSSWLRCFSFLCRVCPQVPLYQELATRFLDSSGCEPLPPKEDSTEVLRFF